MKDNNTYRWKIRADFFRSRRCIKEEYLQAYGRIRSHIILLRDTHSIIVEKFS